MTKPSKWQRLPRCLLRLFVAFLLLGIAPIPIEMWSAPGASALIRVGRTGCCHQLQAGLQHDPD